MDANKIRAKLSTEARGRLEYYGAAYKNALSKQDPYLVNYVTGQIMGYVDALAGFKIITDDERQPIVKYYIGLTKEV